MKKNSSGILILNEKKQILVCHVCGQNFYDLPKGGIEESESPIQAAIRECQEETSILFKDEDLIELGFFTYNKYKNLYLFKAVVNKEDIKIGQLKCSTNHYNEKENISYPEIDGYKWINLNEIEYHCSKSMINVLAKIVNKL